MSAGFVVWFTGLSGAGKSTLAAMLSAELRARGVAVEVLDGDEVRTHLSKGLTFSREDRDTNVRRIGYVAKLVARAGGCAVTAAISPYKAIRDEQRAAIGRFVEVFVRCSIPVLAERDAKGLYKKALAGEIKNFTGIDDPYEEPDAPEVIVDSDRETKEEALARIVAKLEALGYVGGAASIEVGTRARLVTPHGGELTPREALDADASRLRAEAQALRMIALDDRAAVDLDAIASGAFSPLKGFMGSKDYLRVVREMRLETGVPWPVPVTLPVDEETAAALSIGDRVALAITGRAVAVLAISDKHRPDKEREALAVYGPRGLEHPAAARLARSGPVYLGGEVRVFARPRPMDGRRDPGEVRDALLAAGHASVAELWTRRPIHRAEEHLMRAALERCDAVLIRTAPGDRRDNVADVARLRAYEELASRFFPRERVFVAAHALMPDDASLRARLLRALVARNYGASHLVLESDDAELFGVFGVGELGVTPLAFGRPVYSPEAGGIVSARTLPESLARSALSGELAHEATARGAPPPPELVRPEVMDILRDTSPG